MVQSIFTFAKLFLATLRGEDSPRQLAMGVTLGMVVGLVPNDSLLVPVLITLILATYANVFTAACSAIACSWIGLSLDPVLHRLGGQILIHPSLHNWLVWANDAPILPWLRLNNTVVAGSIALAICLVYPCYHFSEMAFRQLAPLVHRRLVVYRLYRFLVAAEAPAPSNEGDPSA